MQAFIAGGLLYAGGLKAVQTASIVAGLPIAVLTLLMSISLMKALRAETSLASTPIGPLRGSKPHPVSTSESSNVPQIDAAQPVMLRASGER